MAKSGPGQQGKKGTKKKRRAKAEVDVIQLVFGEALKRCRKRAAGKISQHKLAAMTGLAKTAVGDLERGKRRIDRDELIKAFQALQITGDDYVKELSPSLARVLSWLEGQEGAGQPEPPTDLETEAANGEARETRLSVNISFDVAEMLSLVKRLKEEEPG